MKIGIIGAGIAGLAAGRELALAGHDVTVIERSHVPGGRLTTSRSGTDGKIVADVGVQSLSATTPLFRSFAAELLEKNLLEVWGDRIIRHDGDGFLDTPPESEKGQQYCAPDGMDQIASYLTRWVDLKPGEKAGGLTYFGANRSLKRPWMINLTSYNTFEADAVIVATPAPEAYGILLTTQDEVNILKLIREIDEIHYEASYSLVAVYGDQSVPEWDEIVCQGSGVGSITSENSKRDLPETTLVIRSSGAFARTYSEVDPTTVAENLLASAASIAGGWLANPEIHSLHHWNFTRPRNVINKPFMEFESTDAPLAVIGDYFEGDDTEYSFCSGLKLAKHWIEKYGS